MTAPKKITLATVKSFIRRNRANLLIDCRSSFDGMTDCLENNVGHRFKPAEATDRSPAYTLGVQGAWFVGQSRDSFAAYDENGLTGIEVWNCCGHFVLAVRSAAAQEAA